MRAHSCIRGALLALGFAVVLFASHAFAASSGSGISCTPGTQPADLQCPSVKADYTCNYGEQEPDQQKKQEGYQCMKNKPCGEAAPGSATGGQGSCQCAQSCKASSVPGKPPGSGSGQPSPQQQPSSSPAQQPASQPGSGSASSGGAAQVSPDNETVLMPSSEPARVVTDTLGSSPESTDSGSGPGSQTPAPDQSLLQSAYQYVTGDYTSAPQPQTDETGSVNSQSAPQSSWLSSVPEYQLQSSDVSGSAADTGGSGGGSSGGERQSVGAATFDSNSNPVEQALGSPLGSSQLTSSDNDAIQNANDAVTLTPSEQAAQEVTQGLNNAVQAAEQYGESVGGWEQSALFPSDQQNPAASADTQPEYLTAYGVCDEPSGCNAMEGAPTTYSTHPDSEGNPTNQIYTLNDYQQGDVPYVTVAGALDQQGNTGVIPSITYNDPVTGETQTVSNVPYMVADTGGDFPNGSSHYDVPLSIPTSDYPSVTGSNSALNSVLASEPFSGQTSSVIPTNDIAESYAIGDPWNTPGTGGLPDYSSQDAGEYPSEDTSWADSALSQQELASLAPTSQSPASLDEGNGFAIASEQAFAESANQNSALEPPPGEEIANETPASGEQTVNAAGEETQAGIWGDQQQGLLDREAQAEQETASYQQEVNDYIGTPQPAGEVESSAIPPADLAETAPVEPVTSQELPPVEQGEVITEQSNPIISDLAAQQPETAQGEVISEESNPMISELESPQPETAQGTVIGEQSQPITEDLDHQQGEVITEQPNPVVTNLGEQNQPFAMPPAAVQTFPFEDPYSIPPELFGGTSPGSELSFAGPSAGAPDFGNAPSWANTVVNIGQSTESAVGAWYSDLQSATDQYAQNVPQTIVAGNGSEVTQEGTQENAGEQNPQPIENPPLPESRPSLPSNPSVVDYLNSIGQDASFATRAALAATNGIENYIGSAAQNLRLLQLCFAGTCFK